MSSDKSIKETFIQTFYARKNKDVCIYYTYDRDCIYPIKSFADQMRMELNKRRGKINFRNAVGFGIFSPAIDGSFFLY